MLNKDLIQFAHRSSKVRKMLIDGERAEAIRLYITGTKFRNITGDPELTDVQVLIITELLDEMSPKGVFKEFNSEIRKSLILFPDRKCNEISEQNLRQTRRFPKSIMDIYGRGRQRSMAQILPERCCSFY